MAGYDAETGRRIYGDARIVQAVKRLLKTHGSLIMRRHLTCDLPRSIGRPGNPYEVQLVRAAVAEAIQTHEQRIELKTIRFGGEDDGVTPEQAADGEHRVYINAISKETGNPIDLSEVIS